MAGTCEPMKDDDIILHCLDCCKVCEYGTQNWREDVELLRRVEKGEVNAMMGPFCPDCKQVKMDIGRRPPVA